MDVSDNSPMQALVSAYSVTFTARSWYAMYYNGQVHSDLKPGQAFAVKARRPGSLHIEEIQSDPIMKPAIAASGCFAGTPFGAFVSDGTRQIEINTTSQVYVQGRAAPQLDHIQTRYGLSSLVMVDILFAGQPLAGFEPVGKHSINGISAAVYGRALSQPNGWAKQCLYLSPENGLPVRYSYFLSGAPGERAEVTRVDYSDWQLDVPFSDSTFDTTAPHNMRPESENGGKGRLQYGWDI